MKKISLLGIAAVSLMLLGAGCGAQKASGVAGTINSELSAGGIQFTTTDKTAAAKAVLDPSVAPTLASLTQYKFTGNDVVLLVAEADSADNAPRLGSYLSQFVESVKSVDPSYSSSSVGGVDPKAAVFVISKDADYDAQAKILGLISK